MKKTANELPADIQDVTPIEYPERNRKIFPTKAGAC
jgi:hypothetical protein